MLIITGTYPPRKCGVGDYCQNLLATSSAKDWQLYTDDKWSLSTILQKFKAIKNINFSIEKTIVDNSGNTISKINLLFYQRIFFFFLPCEA